MKTNLFKLMLASIVIALPMLMSSCLVLVEEKDTPDEPQQGIVEPNVPTDVDYAPANSAVRNHKFYVRTTTQNLVVKFEGQYSVDPAETMLNGEKTLATYNRLSINKADINFGEGKNEVMHLYFLTDHSGEAIYEDKEMGSFTFEKVR